MKLSEQVDFLARYSVPPTGVFLLEEGAASTAGVLGRRRAVSSEEEDYGRHPMR